MTDLAANGVRSEYSFQFSGSYNWHIWLHLCILTMKL